MNEGEFEALCANVWDTTQYTRWGEANTESWYNRNPDGFRPDHLREIIHSALHFQGMGVSNAEG